MADPWWLEGAAAAATGGPSMPLAPPSRPAPAQRQTFQLPRAVVNPLSVGIGGPTAGFDPDRFQQFMQQLQAQRASVTPEQRQVSQLASIWAGQASPQVQGAVDARKRAAALESDDAFFGGIFKGVGNAIGSIPVLGDVAEKTWEAVDDPLMAAMPWLDKPGAAIRNTLFEVSDIFTGKDDGFELDAIWDGIVNNTGSGELLYDRGVENVWTRRIAGLVGDFGTDPFTWLTLGSAAGAKGAAQLSARAMRIAERLPIDDALRTSVIDIGQRATKYGGTRLGNADLDLLRRLDVADNIALGYADDITLRTVFDDLADGGARFGRDAADYTAPTYLLGGTRLNVPGTGRFSQNITNRLTGNRGLGVTQAKTVPILPQRLSRYTPRGVYQGGRRGLTAATDRNILGLGKVRDVLGGDRTALKSIIRNGTPEESFGAWQLLHASVEGGTRSKGWYNSQLRYGIEMIDQIGRDNEKYIFDALQGKKEAIDALGPENYATVTKWRDQFRESANAAAAATEDSPFVRELSTWAPWRLSDELQKVLDEAGENLTPELAELRKFGDPKAKAAKIAPGREYFGQKIYDVNDVTAPENVRGLTPREQADKILTGVFERNGIDFHGKVFSDNFADSLVANIVHISGQIEDVFTINRLAEAGVAVDLNDLASINRAGTNQARIAVDAARDQISRVQGARAEWARAARERATKLRNEAAAMADTPAKAKVARSERWNQVVHKIVDRADTNLKRARQATDETIDALEAQRVVTIEELDGRLARLDATRGKLSEQADRLVARRGDALRRINRLHEELDAAGPKTAGKVADHGKKIAQARRDLARIRQQESALKQVMEVNYADIDRQRVLIGATQKHIDELVAERKALPTKGSGGKAVEARKAAREIDKTIAGLKRHQAAAEEFIQSVDAVISDLPGGLATGAYFRDMARQTDSLSRLEGILGLEPNSLTPDVADAIYRDLIENPGSRFRAQLDEASRVLGQDAEALANDIDALMKEANVPQGVRTESGDVLLSNRRNPENQWAHVEDTSAGPVLTQKTTDRPLLTGDDAIDPRTGRRKPESRRWQVRGENPKPYYGGKAARDADMLETAFKGGLRPTASWGPNWKQWDEVATMVRDGRRLSTSVREVFPVTGWDYQRVASQLLDGDVLSGWQKRRTRELFRDRLRDEGFDSHTFVDANGNWSLVPNDRRQLVKHLEDLPEGPAQTLQQYSDDVVMQMDDTLQAKRQLTEELGADLEELNGRIDNLDQHRADLEGLIDEVNAQFDAAVEAKRTDLADDYARALNEYESAVSLAERADFHLQTMQRLAAEGADEVDIAVQANLAEAARLESLAKKIETNRLAKSKKEPIAKSIDKRLNAREKLAQKELKRAQKDMAKAEKFQRKLDTMDEKAWQTALGSAWKQVGWNSDRAIPRNLAEALNARSTLSDKGTFIKHYDSALKTWRAMATTSPGFHFRNFLGGVINNIHADMNPAMYPLWRKMERVLEDYTHGGGNVRRRIPGLKGAIEAPEDALAMAAARMKGEMKMNPKAVDAWLAIKRSGVAEGGQFDELGMSHLRAQHASLNPFASERLSGKRSTTNPFKADFGIYRASRNIGGSIENNIRGPLALDNILKGGNIDSAIDAVHKFHFDYNDLSQFERNIAHRAMSFYTWSRKNLPLQLEMMFENPKVFNAWQHLQRNLEIGQEEQDALASWVDRTTALRLPWGAGDFYLTPDVPFKEITQMLDPGKIISGSAPPIKLAYEHFTGKSSFTGAPFEGEYQALGPGLGFLYPYLEAVGKAYTTEEGTRVVTKGTFNMITGALPALSVAARLGPAFRDPTSEEPNFGRRTPEQRNSSLISYLFGIGSYVATPSEKRLELMRPAFRLQEEADKLRKLGRTEEAQEFDDAAQAIFDDVNAQYPRPTGDTPRVGRSPGVTPPPMIMPGGTLGPTPEGATSVPLPSGLTEDDVSWRYNGNGTITVRWPGGSQTIQSPASAEDGVAYDFRRDPMTGQLLAAFSERPTGSY